jgi:hypothetical protein
MKIACLVSATITLACMAPASAQTTTTSLTALRANNTSASDSFPGAFNDLPKPGNISPLPITSLLPTGDKTRYIAHLMPWFTLSCNGATTKCGHVSVGYESNDASQVHKQITDMHNRGFSVVFIDWYGPESAHHDGVVQKVMHEAERLKRDGVDFTFAVTPDKGIANAKCGMDKACNTQRLLAALLYAYKAYEQSPAYLHFNGRPVVPFFWSDSSHPVDWDEIHAKVPGNPLFVFQKAEGYKHEFSGGAYSWNGIKAPPDIGMAYLDDFYKASATIDKSEQIVVGSAYPGFDDRLASWGKAKIIIRRCGLTWLDTMKETLKYHQITGSALPYLQVITWNDYEEGTAMEMGIDNCVAAIPGSVQKGHLKWDVEFGKDSQGYTGSEETIAYFRIFTNVSGDKLQELKQVQTNAAHDLDLSPFHLTSGEKLYIQAVGKSQILNHLSEPISVP